MGVSLSTAYVHKLQAYVQHYNINVANLSTLIRHILDTYTVHNNELMQAHNTANTELKQHMQNLQSELEQKQQELTELEIQHSNLLGKYNKADITSNIAAPTQNTIKKNYGIFSILSKIN
jgi:hypothetical protein